MEWKFRPSHAGGDDSSGTRKLKFRFLEPEVGWSRGAWSVAQYPRYNCREFLSLSLSLFSVPRKKHRCSSLLQFNRDETCSDCKLSGYSVAGLNAYDCSPLIARLVNSRTNGLEMEEISISQFCPRNGMFCEIVLHDTFVLLFWKISQNIYVQVIFKDHFKE